MCQKFLRSNGAFAVTIPLGQYGAQTEQLNCLISLSNKGFVVGSRKRVTIYTNAPYLKSLGVTVDLMARSLGSLHACRGARYRLARLKSTLGIQTVRHYKDGRGQWKVVWFPCTRAICVIFGLRQVERT